MWRHSLNLQLRLQLTKVFLDPQPMCLDYRCISHHAGVISLTVNSTQSRITQEFPLSDGLSGLVCPVGVPVKDYLNWVNLEAHPEGRQAAISLAGSCTE